MLKVALKHHVYSFMFVILKENALLNISCDITTIFSKTPLYAIKEKKLFNVRIKQILITYGKKIELLVHVYDKVPI